MRVLEEKELKKVIGNKHNIELATSEDIPRMAEILAQNYDLGKYAGCDNKYACLIYANLVYGKSHYLFKKVDSEYGEAVGFVGYSNQHFNEHFSKKYNKYRKIFNEMINSKEAGNGEEFLRYLSSGSTLRWVMHDLYDNRIEVLINSVVFMGNNLEYDLIGVVEELIKELSNVNTQGGSYYNKKYFRDLYMYTKNIFNDSYNFNNKRLENKGLKRVAELYENEYGEMGYIYKKAFCNVMY